MKSLARGDVTTNNIICSSQVLALIPGARLAGVAPIPVLFCMIYVAI